MMTTYKLIEKTKTYAKRTVVTLAVIGAIGVAFKNCSPKPNPTPAKQMLRK